MDIVKVAHRLGHANPKITLEIYAHLVPNQDNEVADIFHSAIINSVSNPLILALLRARIHLLSKSITVDITGFISRFVLLLRIDLE